MARTFLKWMRLQFLKQAKASHRVSVGRIAFCFFDRDILFARAQVIRNKYDIALYL